MKKIIIILFSVSLLLIVAGVVGVFYVNKNGIEDQSKDKKSFYFGEIKKVKTCKDSVKCDLGSQEFPELKSGTSIEEVLKKIKLINKETEKYYDIAKSSTVDKPACKEAKKYYQSQVYIMNNFQLFENDSIVSIAVNRSIRNLCTDTYEMIPYDVMVYDKVHKKILSSKVLLEKSGYTEEMIKDMIISSINSNNAENGYEIPLDQVFINGRPKYSVFYNKDGLLVLAYQIKNTDSFSYEEVIL